MLMIHAVMIMKCRQFLAEPQGQINISGWRLRFIVLDLLFGMAWMFILIHPIGVEGAVVGGSSRMPKRASCFC